MRIERQTTTRDGLAELRERLDELILPRSADAPVCGPSCPRPAPRDCQRNCPEIAAALSSEPERYPLETGIAPLTFEMARLGVFQTCWSCEGHNGPDGELRKVPRVWFYAESVLHLRVLAEALKEIGFAEKLRVPWQVVATFSDPDNPGSAFSLEPNLTLISTSLTDLQRDIDVIAEKLGPAVTRCARALRASLDAPLGAPGRP
jgi:hypothetical protein